MIYTCSFTIFDTDVQTFCENPKYYRRKRYVSWMITIRDGEWFTYKHTFIISIYHLFFVLFCVWFRSKIICNNVVQKRCHSTVDRLVSLRTVPKINETQRPKDFTDLLKSVDRPKLRSITDFSQTYDVFTTSNV